MLESLHRDVAHALRGLRRESTFTLIAVGILALGIGANTAMFSVVNPLLLRPLPFPQSDRLAWVDRWSGADSDGNMSGSTFRVDVFEELQREARSFSELSGYDAFFGYMDFTLTGTGAPERLAGVPVAPRFFELLGVQPVIGRLFTREERARNGPRATVLSHTLWTRRFHANPAIIGQPIRLNNEPVTVVGVLPPSFDFSATFIPGVRVDVFLPADLEQMRPRGNTLSVVGRLKRGVSPASAHAEVTALAPEIQRRHVWGADHLRVRSLKDYVSGHMRRSLLVLWAAVGLVLLIVCANLSNLLLARTTARRKEIAVRVALGAGRWRVVRQVLTEGLVLSLGGAALGVPIAYLLTMLLRAEATLSVPLLHQVRTDNAALLFTAAVAIVSGLAFGLLPAVRLAHGDPHEALKDQGRGATESRHSAWLRSALVVAEVALACVLLVGAGLLLRSFYRLLQVDLGFQPTQVFAMRLDMGGRAGQTEATRHALLTQIVHRVRALPGVEAAGTSDALPLDRNRAWSIFVPGQDDRSERGPGTSPYVFVTGPGYLRAMNIPLLAGRDFADTDTPDTTLALILNETAAQQLFPGQGPLGRAVEGGSASPDNPYRVIGIVGNVRQTGLNEEPVPQMYVSQAQQGGNATDLIVRSAIPPASLAGSIRTVVGVVDPTVTLTDLRTIDTLVDRAVSPRRFLLMLLGGFSALALLLACLGIYGVVSYGVSQRTPEIGLRMALGATAGDIGREVIGGTLRLALLGLVLGLAGAWLLSRFIESLLFNTSTTDPAAFAATALVLLVVAATAGAAPSLRAARVDPMTALRAE